MPLSNIGIDTESCLAFVAECDGPALTARQLSSDLDCGRDEVASGLSQFKRDGLVESKEINGVEAWWLTDLGLEVAEGSHE